MSSSKPYATSSRAASISRAWIRATRVRLRIARAHARVCASVRTLRREETRAREHTRRNKSEHAKGWSRVHVCEVHYIQAHTYRSPLYIDYFTHVKLAPLFPASPRERPTRGVATPRIERDIDVTSQLSPSRPSSRRQRRVPTPRRRETTPPGP